MVAVDAPLAGRTSRDRRYRVADPYLRFWLTFIEPVLPELERDRGKLVAERILARWPDYLGQAIEPILRESLERLLPDDRLGESRCVGSYWNRTGEPEVDVVLAAEPTSPTAVHWLGSIKWRDRKPFDRRDRERLAKTRGVVPGTAKDTPLLGISATGFDSPGLDLELGPDDLINP